MKLQILIRPIEVATRKSSFFGRPDGFGSSELDEVVDFDAPDRMELVAGSDCMKDIGFLTEERSTFRLRSIEVDRGRDRKVISFGTSRGIWKLGIG